MLLLPLLLPGPFCPSHWHCPGAAGNLPFEVSCLQSDFCLISLLHRRRLLLLLLHNVKPC
jgi:hypothetical protein